MFTPNQASVENSLAVEKARREEKACPDMDGSEASVLRYMGLFHAAIGRYVEKNGKPPLFLYGGAVVPIVQPETIKTASLFATRDFQPASWPKGSVICEIGTWKGYYAKKIMEQADPARLHIIDLTMAAFDRDYFSAYLDEGRVVLHEGYSHDVIPSFEDAYFDIVYFDGDHSYAGVAKDISLMLPKVKTGGLMVFNDYTVWSPLDGTPYGVMDAVNQLLTTGQVEIIGFALHPYGYNDITLRKTAS